MIEKIKQNLKKNCLTTFHLIKRLQNKINNILLFIQKISYLQAAM